MRVRDTGVPAERCESLGRMLEETASRHPRRPALFTEGRVVSYRLLDARTNRFASVLRTRLGIRRGDRVMLVLKRHYQFWFAILGLHKIGAIAIPAPASSSSRSRTISCAFSAPTAFSPSSKSWA